MTLSNKNTKNTQHRSTSIGLTTGEQNEDSTKTTSRTSAMSAVAAPTTPRPRGRPRMTPKPEIEEKASTTKEVDAKPPVLPMTETNVVAAVLPEPTTLVEEEEEELDFDEDEEDNSCSESDMVEICKHVLLKMQTRGQGVLMDELLDGGGKLDTEDEELGFNEADKAAPLQDTPSSIPHPLLNLSEWDVAKVVDVLVALKLITVERHHGHQNRRSRAYAYRTGYGLGYPGLLIEKYTEAIQNEENTIKETSERIKRLKLSMSTNQYSVE